MRTLYHHPLSPLSRLARVALAEKGLPFEAVVEKPWERRTDFLALTPAGEVPVLVEDDGTVIADGWAVIEYLEEAYPDVPLMPPEVAGRAEVRRIVSWFTRKFDREVTENLVGEKLGKRLSGQGQPFAPAIRAGLANIHYHLDYIAFLAERRPWLAGPWFSLADIAAAVEISCVDYVGDVPWDNNPEAKDWYARIKSRPSFRPLLQDSIPGCPPPKHYADLDF
ncbi:glutathione S-transferase family protein [Azospirillum sp.]|uniref:glutathione S-transferase family protein n=1 Tax=Azospirillum sp. TaxID=34012 RepID=UPI002D32870C|nr:glutathione S-transferase family protein [Azospirillum sp.]HYD68638.1 glutathione S-transferase family protein [Azospirillum sp.]